MKYTTLNDIKNCGGSRPPFLPVGQVASIIKKATLKLSAHLNLIEMVSPSYIDRYFFKNVDIKYANWEICRGISITHSEDAEMINR